MKKKSFVIISFFMILAFLTLIAISSNSNENSKHNDNGELDPNAWKNVAEKVAFEEGEDGWYYYFLISTLDNGKTTSNFYQGCSLKYDELDGYGITYHDGDKTFLIKAHPSLAISTKSVDGVLEKDEIITIDDFFDKKQFDYEITVEDLNELKLYNFSAKHVVHMYNLAFNQEYNKHISYFRAGGECSVHKDTMKDGYALNIGVLLQRQGLMTLRMDLMYENGTYLSDLIKSKKATKEQIKVYSDLQEIADYVIENQTVNIRDQFDFKGEVYSRVYELLEKDIQKVE